MVAALERAYPDWGCTLDFTTPFELLVATVLAAQCTDETVNRVTADLFRKYRRPEDYLARPVEELERDIYRTGFFRQKTRSLRGLCAALVERFGGEVPRDIEALTTLPGVGRKTASIVAGAAFGLPGIGVDTHVDRVSRRLGLTAAADGDRQAIEADLRRLLPEDAWIASNWLLILHGRRTCTARRPACPRCVVRDLCPFPEKTMEAT